ncbi:MFS transporter [Niallia sp.]|uniref:MFS transporter n=1 Tax=Niallia sp. TaxID=2837523 RepID=UPI002897B6B7|nr:MFS transporter [Niallia sp.]
MGKNFYLLLLGRIINNIGDSLYAVAAMLLVYDLSNNTFYTGLAGFLTLGTQVFQFLFGPLVDRINHYWILVVTQIIQFVLLGIIPLLYYFDSLGVAVVLVSMPIISLVQQIVYPTQTAIVSKVVDEDNLIKANSYMNSAYQTLDIILTGVSGIIISFLGVISIYWIDAGTFALTALIYSLLKIEKRNKNKNSNDRIMFKETRSQYKGDLKEGYLSVKNSIIPKFLLASIVANFMIGSLTAVLPEYSISRGGEHFYGLYLGSLSAGLLLGSLLANVFKKHPLGYFTIISFFLSGLAWIASGVISNNVISIVLFGCCYISIGITNVIFIATLQKIIPQNFIGRVFSLIASLTGIAAPLGSLFGGSLSLILGSHMVFLSGGIGLVFVSVFWISVPSLRKLPNSSKMKSKEYFNVTA